MSLQSAPSPPPAYQADAPCAAALCGAASLRPYFDALQARTTLSGAPPVHVMMLGDSHSAGEAISGPWRDILQARYGAGGRGVLPPGDPYLGFRPRQVHVEQSAGWRAEATFGKSAPPSAEAEIFGLSGVRLTALGSGAALGLAAEPRAAFSRVVVCAVTGPFAGRYVVELAARTETVSLSGPPGVSCDTFAAEAPETAVSLVTQGGPVTLISWGVFGAGGVALSNLGVVGAQLRHFARADDAALARELKAYAPDLLVLEFGTNEGFGGRFDSGAYEAVLCGQIERLKRLSGGAPILVLGAPDAGADRPALAHNADPAPGGASASETRTGRWFPPPALARVREIQRRVAAAEGVAFWDWAARMGGAGAAQAWAAASPPLLRPDHVHYTAEGGARIAALLQADLDAAMAGAPNP